MDQLVNIKRALETKMDDLPSAPESTADTKGSDGKPDMSSIDAAITSALKNVQSASPKDDDEFHVKSHDELKN